MLWNEFGKIFVRDVVLRKTGLIMNRTGFFVFGATPERSIGVILAGKFSGVFDFELGIFVVLVDGFE